MTATTAQAASSSSVLTSNQVFWVAIGIGVLALVVVLLPLLLAWSYHGSDQNAPAESDRPQSKRASFYEIPFITWFIVHYGIAALAILAIVLLGVDNVIDKGTVSALLGSLFGYVLGSAAHSSRPSNGGSSFGTSQGSSVPSQFPSTSNTEESSATESDDGK